MVTQVIRKYVGPEGESLNMLYKYSIAGQNHHIECFPNFYGNLPEPEDFDSIAEARICWRIADHCIRQAGYRAMGDDVVQETN